MSFDHLSHTISIPLHAQLSDFTIQHWYSHGIKTLSNLYTNDSLKAFWDMQSEYRLPNSYEYTHTRITHFLKVSKIPSVVNIPEPLHQFYAHIVNPQHGISMSYTALNDNPSYSQITILSKCLKELNSSARTDMWSRAIRLTYTASPCSNHWESYQKALHRWYLTPYRLSKIYPGNPGGPVEALALLCTSCGSADL